MRGTPPSNFCWGSISYVPLPIQHMYYLGYQGGNFYYVIGGGITLGVKKYGVTVFILFKNSSYISNIDSHLKQLRWTIKMEQMITLKG